MKNLKQTVLALAVVAAVAVPAGVQAHCGSCGVGEAKAGHTDHGHAEEGKVTESKVTESRVTETKLTAIYPLAEAAGFKTLTAAIKVAGLDEVLTTGGPFTVFAPTDEAFAKLPEGTVAGLLANPEQLKKVLLFHVVSGSVMAADVVKLKQAETLNGEKVSIDAKQGVKINGATVIKADLAASNGTVHVIDTVLIPKNL